MTRKIERRGNGKKSVRRGPHPVPLLPGTRISVVLALLLSSAICARVEAQNTTVLLGGSGQAQIQNGSGNSASLKPNQAQAAVNSIGGGITLPGKPGGTSGRTAKFTQRLNRSSGVSSQGSASSLCFQPGVGWMRQSLSPDTATRAFQTVSSSMVDRTAKAQKLAPAADSMDCGGSSLAPDNSLASLLEGSNTGSALAGKSMAASINAPPSQSGSSASSSAPSGQNSQGALPSAILTPGGSGSSYSYSGKPPSTSVSISPSISHTGELLFSIASPQQISINSEAAIQNTTVEVPIYSFTPGTGPAASASLSGETSSHVNWSTLQSEMNKVIGREPEELKSQEKKASVGTTIATEDVHEYRQLRTLCRRLEAAQQAGDVSNTLTMEIVGGRKATELARLREDCGQFLVMGKGAAIKKMQKHKGLK
jgi:hypothetical protein